MKLLMLINGNAKTIFDVCRLDSSLFQVVKVDEKTLAKPKEILKHIRKPYDQIFFGCIDINYQRFIPFMILYILFSKAKKGGVIDENGKKIDFSLFTAIFIVPPRLIVEFSASIIIIVYSYICFYLWWKRILRN